MSTSLLKWTGHGCEAYESPILHSKSKIKTMKKPGKSAGRSSWTQQAVGSYEAAAIMGVHYATPARMVAKGMISATMLDSAYSDDPSRVYAIYDGLECEENYKEYEENLSARGGKTERRPRSWLHLRPEVLERLRKAEHPIAFDDAIGGAEASKILGVHVTFLSRLVAQGKIVGRQPWNPRSTRTAAAMWIFSRKSCLANARETRKLEADGAKRGRPRKIS